MASEINIWNNALGECQAQAIQSLDEGSVEAGLVARHYPDALLELLEFHDFHFAERTAKLVKTDNDRLGEWRFAYKTPAHIAKALRVFPYAAPAQTGGVDDLQTRTDLSFPAAGPFNVPSIAAIGTIPFRHVDDIIFCNLEDAVLEYTTTDIEVGNASSLFAWALTLNLATKLVMPIRKDRKLKGDLIQQYELARDRASAFDMNANPRVDRTPISDREMARAGVYEDFGYHNGYSR